MGKNCIYKLNSFKLVCVKDMQNISIYIKVYKLTSGSIFVSSKVSVAYFLSTKQTICVMILKSCFKL